MNEESICLNIEQQACSNLGITVLMKRSFKIASKVGLNELTNVLVNKSVSTYKINKRYNYSTNKLKICKQHSIVNIKYVLSNNT